MWLEWIVKHAIQLAQKVLMHANASLTLSKVISVLFLVSLSFTTMLMSIVLFREVDSLAEQISAIKNQNK